MFRFTAFKLLFTFILIGIVANVEKIFNFEISFLYGFFLYCLIPVIIYFIWSDNWKDNSLLGKSLGKLIFKILDIFGLTSSVGVIIILFILITIVVALISK